MHRVAPISSAVAVGPIAILSNVLHFGCQAGRKTSFASPCRQLWIRWRCDCGVR